MTCRSAEMAHYACSSLRQPSLLAISCSWFLLYYAIVYRGHLRACTGHACSASRCRNRIQCRCHWCAAWILERSVFVFCSATSCAVVHGLLVGACPQRGQSPDGTEGRRVCGGCGVCLQGVQTCHRRGYRARRCTEFVDVHGGQKIGQPREYQSG